MLSVALSLGDMAAVNSGAVRVDVEIKFAWLLVQGEGRALEVRVEVDDIVAIVSASAGSVSFPVAFLESGVFLVG